MDRFLAGSQKSVAQAQFELEQDVILEQADLLEIIVMMGEDLAATQAIVKSLKGEVEKLKEGGGLSNG